MPGRFSPLIAAWVLSAVCTCPGVATAHRLVADFKILPDARVQVESWFDLTGDSPRNARIQVFRVLANGANGDLLVEGRLDDKGIFVFPFQKAEMLRVVISAGAGHGQKLDIPES